MRSFDQLLGLLSNIPDPRRAEGKLYKLQHVLLFSILAVVTGGNSYRSIVTFIKVHRRRLNAAFGLHWRHAPAHTSIRYILQGLDPQAVEQIFRQHAACHAVVWKGLIHFRCSAEGLATCSANPYLTAMETLASWSPVPELEVNSVERREPGWLVAVDSRESASCPECGTQSSSRHSSYLRTLQDLSTQGTPVTIQARVTRWRCRNEQCGRRIFAERLPTLAAPFARRTARFAGIVRLVDPDTAQVDDHPSDCWLASACQ